MASSSSTDNPSDAQLLYLQQLIRLEESKIHHLFELEDRRDARQADFFANCLHLLASKRSPSHIDHEDLCPEAKRPHRSDMVNPPPQLPLAANLFSSDPSVPNHQTAPTPSLLSSVPSELPNPVNPVSVAVPLTTAQSSDDLPQAGMYMSFIPIRLYSSSLIWPWLLLFLKLFRAGRVVAISRWRCNSYCSSRRLS